jgi:hypothetical protein
MARMNLDVSSSVRPPAVSSSALSRARSAVTFAAISCGDNFVVFRIFTRRDRASVAYRSSSSTKFDSRSQARGTMVLSSITMIILPTLLSGSASGCTCPNRISEVLKEGDRKED